MAEGTQGSRKSDIVISSRIRLARNIENIPFPARMGREQCLEVIDKVKNAVYSNTEAPAKDLLFLELQRLNPIERQVLVEKHLISPDLAESSRESAAIISRDEKISIMVNEEDHLRLQCIFPGMQLDEAWNLCKKLDDFLGERLDFAFDRTRGYLTCCPTNIGTGIRASMMLHLPALSMTGYIKGILEACSKLNVAVRGIYGENSEASGNMFQISNQVTQGQTEDEIVESVKNVASQISEQEKVLRNELYEQNSSRFEDRVYRSLGVLQNARIISAEESLKLLSDIRLGADMGVISGIKFETLNDLILFIQPAYLQKMAGRPLSPDERDVRRAELVRNRLRME